MRFFLASSLQEFLVRYRGEDAQASLGHLLRSTGHRAVMIVSLTHLRRKSRIGSPGASLTLHTAGQESLWWA